MNALKGLPAVAVALTLSIAGCGTTPDGPVSISFPDFPNNVVSMDLGQSVTIDAVTLNDHGAGVTWTCLGTACAPLKTTLKTATFKASGITGEAVMSAVSRKQPAVSRKLTITVSLNDSPDMLCR